MGAQTLMGHSHWWGYTSASFSSCELLEHTDSHKKKKTKEPDFKQKDHISIERNGTRIFQPDLAALSRQGTMDGILGNGLFIPCLTLFANCPVLCLFFSPLLVLISSSFPLLLASLWRTHTSYKLGVLPIPQGQKLGEIRHFFFYILNYYCREQIVQSSWEHLYL